MKTTKPMHRYTLHAVCAAVIIVFVTLFMLFQSVVDEQGAPFTLSQFLHPKTFIGILQAIHQQSPTPKMDSIYFVENNALFVNPDHPSKVTELPSPMQDNTIFSCFSDEKRVFAYADSNHQVVLVSPKQTTTVSVLSTETTQIMQCSKNGVVVAAWKNEKTWSIGTIDTTKEKPAVKVIQRNIQYPQTTLGFNTQPIEKYIAYPSCDPSCMLHLLPVEGGQEIIYPFIGDESSQQRYADFEFNFSFFDEKNKLVGYWFTEDSRPYRFIVTKLGEDLQTNGSTTLLQSIHLDANRARLLSYADYDPQSQFILFTTHPDKKNYQEVFAYSATYPRLRLLGNVEKDAKVQFINGEGIYVANNKLKSVLNSGWQKKTEKKLILMND